MLEFYDIALVDDDSALFPSIWVCSIITKLLGLKQIRESILAFVRNITLCIVLLILWELRKNILLDAFLQNFSNSRSLLNVQVIMRMLL